MATSLLSLGITARNQSAGYRTLVEAARPSDLNIDLFAGQYRQIYTASVSGLLGRWGMMTTSYNHFLDLVENVAKVYCFRGDAALAGAMSI